MRTTFYDRELISGAMQAGVNGYLLKETTIEEIVKAVETVHDGSVLVSEKVMDKLVDSENRIQAQRRHDLGLPAITSVTPLLGTNRSQQTGKRNLQPYGSRTNQS